MADELMSRKETREKAKSPIPSSLLFYSPLNSWVELMRFYGGISYLMYLQHFFFTSSSKEIREEVILLVLPTKL